MDAYEHSISNQIQPVKGVSDQTQTQPVKENESLYGVNHESYNHKEAPPQV